MSNRLLAFFYWIKNNESKNKPKPPNPEINNQGLTVRDYFATHAMEGMVTDVVVDPQKIARMDGNQMNFDPSNLTLMSRSELLALNRFYKHKESDPTIKPVLITAAKLKSKISKTLNSVMTQ